MACLLSYRVFSLTWPASMQIYWDKRKCLHKKRVQLPKDWFGTPTWPPFYCFGAPIWPPWRRVKTLYIRRTSNSGPEEGWIRDRFLIGRKEGGDRYDSKGNIGRGVLYSSRLLRIYIWDLFRLLKYRNARQIVTYLNRHISIFKVPVTKDFSWERPLQFLHYWNEVQCI